MSGIVKKHSKYTYTHILTDEAAAYLNNSDIYCIKTKGVEVNIANKETGEEVYNLCLLKNKCDFPPLIALLNYIGIEIIRG